MVKYLIKLNVISTKFKLYWIRIFFWLLCFPPAFCVGKIERIVIDKATNKVIEKSVS